ncbi:MAG: DNA alkylation repair protein [Alloprevotella sp.]|uniref:DNA alkylation repair protein n=1 Tax=Alloprevotella sp. Lung230 TaxID=2766595 RepID=UPI00165516CF|nr:DNA alkylation repair protein [Alloprevotella sp. Lung230]MBC8626683.1 DNA alkylation repair protein [Alloprevotella sp. Lung230]
MQNLPLEDQIREIKKMLRATMNGVLSGSMRQQGLTYRVNFGVDQPRLIELSDEIPHTAALAAKLWKEDIRELRLLAPMLMPRDEMDEELALLWIEQLHFAEEAQVLVMHLLCHLPFASDIAFRLVASEQPMSRLVAWLLLGRLFMAQHRPSQRDADELLDHLESELTAQGNDPELKRTALNTLYKFMDLGAAETARGERLLESLS